MFAMQSLRRQHFSPCLRRYINDSNPRLLRHLHASAIVQNPRKRTFFSSNANLQQDTVNSKVETVKDVLLPQKRKPARNPPGKTSLRRVAVEAQRSRANTLRQQNASEPRLALNRVTAISVADQFDMIGVIRILRSHGFIIDPDQTGFESDEVIHTRGKNDGDIFVFPSGSVVAWGLSEDVVSDLAAKTLLPAAISPHMGQTETEDLEYEEDPKRDSSTIKGDVIMLGTKTESQVFGSPKYVSPLSPPHLSH